MGVRYSWAELMALARRVTADNSWMKSIDAELESSGVDIERNLVKVEISSGNPSAGDTILEHYSATGRMYIETDGTGVLLMPTGTLVVRAVDSHGRPIRGLVVLLDGDLPGTGGGDLGESTNANGEWRGDITAIGYMVRLNRDGKEVASKHIVVEAGATTNTIIVVP